jgi:hypothetical protein
MADARLGSSYETNLVRRIWHPGMRLPTRAIGEPGASPSFIATIAATVSGRAHRRRSPWLAPPTKFLVVSVRSRRRFEPKSPARVSGCSCQILVAFVISSCRGGHRRFPE